MKPNNEHKLFENMLRFKTKNLALNEGLAQFAMKLFSNLNQVFKQNNYEHKIIKKMFRDILEMLKQDTEPEAIIRYMQQQDATITRETAISIIKDIARFFDFYVDFKNDSDITPTT